jgi:transcription elongation factor Elf1
MRKVLLQNAFAWVCDSCGKMNYIHATQDYLTEEQFIKLFEQGTPGGEGAYIDTAPSIVVCPLCKESFETELEELTEDVE